MGETAVVGPGLTPDWLRKRKGIFGAIEEQTILGLERPGAGWSLDDLQKAIVEKGAAKILRPRSIVILRQVPVHRDRTWLDQIAISGPQTDADNDVHKVGDQYVAEKKDVVLKDITLVNFGLGVNKFEQVVSFGAEWQLGRTIDPWECFAVSEHLPKLNTMPGFFDPMAVVSLKEYFFRNLRQVVGVWFCNGRRMVILSWLEGSWSDV